MSLGLTAQDVADRCAEAGHPDITRGLLANIETGRRRDVTLDQAVVLAYVLETPLTAMLSMAAGDLDDEWAPLVRVGSVKWSDLPRDLTWDDFPDDFTWDDADSTHAWIRVAGHLAKRLRAAGQ